MKRFVYSINSHGIPLILFYFLRTLYKTFIFINYIYNKFYIQLIILNYSEIDF